MICCDLVSTLLCALLGWGARRVLELGWQMHSAEANACVRGHAGQKETHTHNDQVILEATHMLSLFM